MTLTDLQLAAVWASLPREIQSHARLLMLSRKPYEAMRVLVAGTGSAPKARALVAWLAELMIREAT